MNAAIGNVLTIIGDYSLVSQVRSTNKELDADLGTVLDDNSAPDGRLFVPEAYTMAL